MIKATFKFLNRLNRKKMSYIYNPNCKNCIKPTANYCFTCILCGTSYSACVKEISGKKEKLIYCRYPGGAYLGGDFYQNYWENEFKGNLILMK